MDNWILNNKTVTVCIIAGIVSSLGLFYWYENGWETPAYIQALSIMGLLLSVVIGVAIQVGATPETCPKCGSEDLWSRLNHSEYNVALKTTVSYYDYKCNKCGECFSDD